MMEKMENIVFDRNYEEDEPDPLAQAIFDRVNAPGGFLEEFSKKMDAIPKVIVPKDKENYEYLLGRCDEFAKRHHGKIHGVVDFEHWDAHIDLTLPMLEFDDPEDMSLLKDIGEKAHYCCITTQEDDKFHFHVMINYFEEIMSEEYGDYLKFETLAEDDELAAMLNMGISEEDEAVVRLIGEILDRFDNETHVDKTTAFKAVASYLMQNDPDAISYELIAATLTALLEKVLDDEKHEED